MNHSFNEHVCLLDGDRLKLRGDQLLESRRKAGTLARFTNGGRLGTRTPDPLVVWELA